MSYPIHLSTNIVGPQGPGVPWNPNAPTPPGAGGTGPATPPTPAPAPAAPQLRPVVIGSTPTVGTPTVGAKPGQPQTEPAGPAAPADPVDSAGQPNAAKVQAMSAKGTPQEATPGNRPGTQASIQSAAARAGMILGAFDPRRRATSDQNAITAALSGVPLTMTAAQTMAIPPSLGFSPKIYEDEQRILGVLQGK